MCGVFVDPNLDAFSGNLWCYWRTHQDRGVLDFVAILHLLSEKLVSRFTSCEEGMSQTAKVPDMRTCKLITPVEVLQQSYSLGSVPRST